MLTVRLYMLQRITALLMAPLVLGHLAVMIYAVQGGLSAAEILGRTQGSIAWLLFYGGFVIAVSVHAAIGLRVIVHETLGLRVGPAGLETELLERMAGEREQRCDACSRHRRAGKGPWADNRGTRHLCSSDMISAMESQTKPVCGTQEDRSGQGMLEGCGVI